MYNTRHNVIIKSFIELALAPGHVVVNHYLDVPMSEKEGGQVRDIKRGRPRIHERSMRESAREKNMLNRQVMADGMLISQLPTRQTTRTPCRRLRHKHNGTIEG